MRQTTKPRRRRLRKQPRLRRVDLVGTTALPGVVVPKTAKSRRKRNRKRIPFPTAAFIKLATSPRWLSLGLALICIMAFLLIGHDEAFYLTTLPVEGATSISDSEIARITGLEGAHIFAADPNEAAARLAEMPGVISATVTVEWPNQVKISIAEDTPVLMWIQAGERYWVYGDGRLLSAGLTDSQLLRISSELDEPIGEQEFIPFENREDIIKGALKLQAIRPNINEFSFKPGPGLSYQDGRGWTAYFGTGQDMEQRLAVYEAIVEHLQARDVTPAYVSVSNYLKPYYMPISEESEG